MPDVRCTDIQFTETFSTSKIGLFAQQSQLNLSINVTEYHILACGFKITWRLIHFKTALSCGV